MAEARKVHSRNLSTHRQCLIVYVMNLLAAMRIWLRPTMIAFGEKERHCWPLTIVWLLIYHIRMRIAILR